MVLWPLALIILTGALLMTVLRAPVASWRSITLSKLPLAFGAGTVLLHIGFLLLSWLGPVPLWSCGVVPALLATLLGWRQWRGRELSPSESSDDAWPMAAWAGLGGLLLVQLLMLLPVLELPLFDWEGRMLWALKSKFLAAAFTVSSEPFLDPYRLHIHPRYPLLVPWLTALLGRVDGGFREGHYLAVILIFALLTTWQLYYCLVRTAGHRFALVGGGILLASSVWYTAAINLQVEIVLAFYLLSALCCLIVWLETGQGRDLCLAGVMLAGAVMTKNEGVLLAACVIVALAVACGYRGAVGKALAAAGSLLGVVLLLGLPWFLQRKAIPAVSDENYLQRLNVATVLDGVTRLPLIVRSAALQMADWELWQLFWLVVPPLVLLTLLMWRRVMPAPRLVALAWLGYFLGIMAVYLISPWADIALHIENSFDRVMLPLLPCGVLLLGLLAGRRFLLNPP